jgi:endogenous inhibitor of DNA gyrase (YacG/DUF329 family)
MGGNGSKKDKSKQGKHICPSCSTEFSFNKSDEDSRKAFPFCSARCKMADLGKWFSGNYRISRPIRSDDIDEMEATDE